MSARGPTWHAHRRWIVAVAAPAPVKMYSKEVHDWKNNAELSRECHESMTTLRGIPLRVEHGEVQEHTAGVVLEDIQTPYDDDGRRIVVAEINLDHLGGGPAAELLDRGIVRECSILHSQKWLRDPETGEPLSGRGLQSVELSLVEKGRRPGCHILGKYRERPSKEEIDRLVRETNPKAPEVAQLRLAAYAVGF